MSADNSLVHETGSLLSGLTTNAVWEPQEGPRGLAVSWIDWLSRFRGTGLQIGDRITEVNGLAINPLLLPGKLHGLLGQVGESSTWEKHGAKAGDPLRLKIWRPDGEREVLGALVPERLFRDAGGKSSLAPGGPPRLENDGFSSAWMTWYEKLVWKIQQVLDGAWESGKLNTRQEFADLLEHGARIEALNKKYPGEFAETTKADWLLAVESLRGKKAEQVDLTYREIGAQRLVAAKKAAAAAWEELKQEESDRLIPAFPAPEIEARASVAGKWVELPWITPSGLVNDLGQSWAVAENAGEVYLARMSGSPEFAAFYGALRRFGTLVQPATRQRYQFIGELLPTPAMITYRDRPVTGHQLRMVAARAGESGEFAVDLRKTPPTFAGESEMSPIGSDTLNDDASPADVLAFMADAIKRADEAAWRRCFATWRAGVYDSGRPQFLPLYVSSTGEWNSAWEAARRLIMQNVYDLRVDRVGPIHRLFEADPETGVPAVDRVVAYVDIFGLFDGEYRSFNHFTVNRRRVLQRINQGPWRLAEIQGL